MSSLGWALGLAHKQWNMLERLARSKRFSLLQKFVTYVPKMFYNIDPWCATCLCTTQQMLERGRRNASLAKCRGTHQHSQSPHITLTFHAGTGACTVETFTLIIFLVVK